MRMKGDQAVSPVVGVMLMLVVTIIIAAVVSAFAGGMSTGKDKAPQATVKAKFSQSNGMEIYHMGGDTINTQSTSVIVRPTRSFGNYDQLSWVINKSVIKTDNKDWVNQSVSMTYNLARTFKPGDTAYILSADLPRVQEKTGGVADYYSNSYGFGNVKSVGNSFILTLTDDSGKSIASTEVEIRS